MSNLTPEQEAMNRAHSDNGNNCLPNCWRSHQGDPEPTRPCNWCDRRLTNNTEQYTAHLEYHMSNPESVTK